MSPVVWILVSVNKALTSAGWVHRKRHTMNRTDLKSSALLEDLLASYAGKVRSLIQGHHLDRHGIDPDDVEQAVRIRLWKTLDQDQPAGFCASFIQRVVLTTVIDAIRAARSRESEPLPENEDSVAFVALTASPEDVAMHTEEIRHASELISSLPGQRGDAVALHLEGFSFQEIGCRIRTSEEAARKLVRRGLERLRELWPHAGTIQCK